MATLILGTAMKLAYNRFIQRVADKLEAATGLRKLELSEVIQAVESLEDEGYSLDYVADRVDLVARRMNR